MRRRTRHAAAVAVLAGASGAGTAACSVSPQQEAQIGAQYSAEINRQLPVVTDPSIHRYINVLGNEIARNVSRPFNYQFFVVNIDGVNAFALPGGYVYVNSGLIDETDNLSELAGVLAHEIGHVEHRHGAEQMERMQRAELGLTAAYVLLGRAPSGVERAAINVGGSAYMAKHSREAENEADASAVGLLVRSGIDPSGLVTFFSELLEERKRRPSSLEQWFSTHPLTEDRIENTRALVERVPASQRRGLTTNSAQFRDFKARVARLPQPPPEFRQR